MHSGSTKAVLRLCEGRLDLSLNTAFIDPAVFRLCQDLLDTQDRVRGFILELLRLY
jgi:hypothetical protein